MTKKRDLADTSVAGNVHLPNLSDSLEEVFSYNAGNALSVTGTNAIQVTIPVVDGLDGHKDGMLLSFVAANDNTGSVTIEITGDGSDTISIGSKDLRDKTGAALTGGELVAGTAYVVKFYGAQDHWRLVSEPSIQTSGVNSKQTVFLLSEEFTSSGTFTAPHKCNVRVWAIGAGGGGGHNPAVAAGGGAGGLSVRDFEMNSGETLTVTIGSGGAGKTGDNGSGADGGDTTVTGTDVNDAGFDPNISAAGGSGGAHAGSGTANGGTGGSASGGDFNFSGGRGGNATGGPSGGGAVGFNANGNNGGDGNGTDGGDGQFNNSTLAPFDLKGRDGGAFNSGTGGTGDDFCGGGGGGATGGQGGRGGGGGGGQNTAGGDGGAGLVVIQYTADIS